MKTSNNPPSSTSPEQAALNRRSFLRSAGLGATALGLLPMACSTGKQPAQSTAGKPPIQGFERTQEAGTAKKWTPVSDRKVRVGIVGYGLCKFGAEFGFQNHPNVEIVAVSDLFPDRCEQLAKACRCTKTYPSLEELVKDDRIEAVFIATDAPSHAKQAILALKHGKHVASAVPAVFGSLEEADQLYEAVKTSGKKYMMFETSCFHEDLYAMRQIYNAGGLGKLVYSEGEYYHYMDDPLPSYKEWRVGLPPQYYPTHSNAYYIGVTGGSFTEVSCLGMPSIVEQLKPANNRYKNPFGSEIAMFRTSEGGSSRMAVSWDTPGDHGERGRIRGQRGSFYGKYEGLEKVLPDLVRPALPPGVDAGGHGGSHGRLTDEFITAILQDRQPLVDISMALNMTVSGIVAHQSAMRNGETLKIPQYKILS
ncbi:putative dehydrogenase [Larkinella arboricola]|uniref:Putative dehydrogenase n=1 Tax=Larkinella arboricola TaxID=643671 RepID=A0A327X9F5_LARAB|nr:Gfo/Idh/MocA family oxidoreductase [Larkinella arboricola]RAK02282.1 putative dehydrogenase [Larkinella arboricola]